MIVGVPKEIKNNENRVGLTPASVAEYVARGHRVYVQDSAGEGSGFSNELYEQAGAEILPTIADVYKQSEMIVKVKEPIEPEYELIQEGQLLFTYFHFAASEELTDAMIRSKSVCLAYETVERANGALPLLVPMSEVAGRMAVQQGAKYLEKPMGGKGVLLGGVPGVRAAKVIILGGGIVGYQAGKMAAGLLADVTIMDINLDRLRYLTDVMSANVSTQYSSKHNILNAIQEADLIIGAVLIPGAKAPNLITRDMLALIKPGTVMVDVAVDQGGCIETCRPTTHQDPVYTIDGVVHYCVANMPGAVPYTSTIALNNATLPYGLELAKKGWKQAALENRELLLGLNVVEGKVVYKAVAEAFDLEYTPVSEVLTGVGVV